MTSSDLHLVVKVEGKSEQRYFTLGPRHARMLGLIPREGAEHELLLADGADPDAVLLMPNGLTFTAFELTALRHKSGSKGKGWQVDSCDPCGYPPSVDI